MRTPTGRNNMLKKRDGFTLLEVLVAFALLATAVTLILQLFSSNFKTLSTSEEHINAVMRAELAMREVLGREELGESAWTEMTFDGYRIDVNIVPIHEGRTKDLPLRMLEIAVTLSWQKRGQQKMLTIRTMKLTKQVVKKA